MLRFRVGKIKYDNNKLILESFQKLINLCFVLNSRFLTPTTNRLEFEIHACNKSTLYWSCNSAITSYGNDVISMFLIDLIFFKKKKKIILKYKQTNFPHFPYMYIIIPTNFTNTSKCFFLPLQFSFLNRASQMSVYDVVLNLKELSVMKNYFFY